MIGKEPPRICECGPALLNRCDNRREIIIRQDKVRSFVRNVRARETHRNADIRFVKGRSIIDASETSRRVSPQTCLEAGATLAADLSAVCRCWTGSEDLVLRPERRIIRNPSRGLRHCVSAHRIVRHSPLWGSFPRTTREPACS